MFETVAIPVWALVLIALAAALTILERIIGPSVRWFFRKRAERVVAEVNKRLERPIEPFKLARRHDMIQRLKYDPEVAQAIVEHSRAEGVREDVAFEMVERYAREIVPAFSASAYFGFGIRVSKWLSNLLYQTRLDSFDQGTLEKIDPDAAVVFVMNHRSNMDYVLVTWLVAQRSTLSYAVGEWARVWPLSMLIRSMGAFFIRRKSRNALYRKVLARYVQMATRGGVTQAVFPEGGLSLDGRMAEPKLGFLNYIVSGFEPGERDVVFVPVALNYDRVLEDRVLIAADKAGTRKFRASIPTAIGFALRQVGKMIRRTFRRFGYAAVSFGAPLSLTEFAGGDTEDLTERVAEELRARIAGVVPILPVPLVASVLEDAAAPVSRNELAEKATARLAALKASGAHIYIPEGDVGEAIETALRVMTLRHIVTVKGENIEVVAAEKAMLAFYANSIRHLISD